MKQKMKIKYGIQFIQLGALDIMTAKLRYTLHRHSIHEIYDLKEQMKIKYDVEVSIRQDQKYITLEFACLSNRLVLHELQLLQYEIAKRRLDDKFYHMHALKYEQHYQQQDLYNDMADNFDYEAMESTTEKTVNGKTYMLHKPEAEL